MAVATAENVCSYLLQIKPNGLSDAKVEMRSVEEESKFITIQVNGEWASNFKLGDIDPTSFFHKPVRTVKIYGRSARSEEYFVHTFTCGLNATTWQLDTSTTLRSVGDEQNFLIFEITVTEKLETVRKGLYSLLHALRKATTTDFIYNSKEKARDATEAACDTISRSIGDVLIYDMDMAFKNECFKLLNVNNTRHAMKEICRKLENIADTAPRRR